MAGSVQTDIYTEADGSYSKQVRVIGDGGASTVADGADVNSGTTTDAAVVTDANGTLSAKIRGLVVLILAMSAKLPATLGQKAMAASMSVALASDQSAVPVSGTGINVAATASEEGDESGTDEAVAAAAAGTRLMGFSARETAGAVATFSIHNGTGNGDPLLVTVSLAANESAREWYGESGIAAAGGIWLQRITGTVSFVGYSKVVA